MAFIPRILGRRFSIEAVETKLARPEFSLEGLSRPRIFPEFPVEVETEAMLPRVREYAPTDGVEVVEWMQDSAADNAILDSIKADYERGGSLVFARSGDPAIPGLSVYDTYFPSVRGSTVASRGYAVLVTPYGNFNVPARGKLTLTMRDFLGWGAAPWVGGFQWRGVLMRWVELASTPIENRVGFLNSSGLVAPQFFRISTKRLPMATMRLGLSSNKEQTVVVTGRDTADYGTVLFSADLNIPAGQSESVIRLFSLPMRPFAMEIQPSDGTSTVLDSLSVFP